MSEALQFPKPRIGHMICSSKAGGALLPGFNGNDLRTTAAFDSRPLAETPSHPIDQAIVDIATQRLLASYGHPIYKNLFDNCSSASFSIRIL